MTRQTQQDKILARLRRGPATSWQLGPELGILSLTRRIYELRKRYEITSSEQWEGRKRIVTYQLVTRTESEQHIVAAGNTNTISSGMARLSTIHSAVECSKIQPLGQEKS